jgi:hypothetical protein
MSFDVKIGKINHGGTETQRRSQISDFRRQRADQLGEGQKSEVGSQRSEDRGRSWEYLESNGYLNLPGMVIALL